MTISTRPNRTPWTIAIEIKVETVTESLCSINESSLLNETITSHGGASCCTINTPTLINELVVWRGEAGVILSWSINTGGCSSASLSTSDG